MSKLSFEALEARASEVISQELLNSISGGNENACHDTPPPPPADTGCGECQETVVQTGGRVNPLGLYIIHTICHD